MKLTGLVFEIQKDCTKLMLWQLKVMQRSVGRPSVSFNDTLLRGANIDNIIELKTAMLYRDDWRKRTEHLQEEPRPKYK